MTALDELEAPKPKQLASDVILAKRNQMVQIDQWVRINYHEICVATVEEQFVKPFTISFDRPSKPKPPQFVLEDGSKLIPNPEDDPDNPRIIFVDVIYKNPHADQTLNCRTNQWSLYDEDGYSYEPKSRNNWLYENNGKAFLGANRQLNPNLKLRGWLAFEIPRKATPQRLQFLDGFISGNSVDFSLE
ncbi:MAG: DUF4352 domain-containing protein [Chloroflexota bacterium]